MYKPLGRKVIIKDTERPEETESGIYLGKAKADNSSKSGTVIAVGPLVQSVKVDDVVYLQWANIRTVKDGDDYLGIIEEDDILAVLEN